LAFDSEEISSVIKDIGLLKTMFQKDMEEKVPLYLELVKYPFTDKEVGILIEYFKDNSKRKEFFRFYKELESLYEIISPDAFLRPYIDNYRILSEIYFIVRNAFANRVYVDREFLNKTCELMRQKIDIDAIEGGFEIFEIDGTALKKIKSKRTDDSVKVINLVKSIIKYAEENSGDLFLISLAQKAKEIQEAFENRQKTTQDTLDALMILVAQEEDRMLERNKKGFDGFTYFVYGALRERNISNPEEIAKQMKETFNKFPHWQASEQESRDLRTELYFIFNKQAEDFEKSFDFVEYLFELLEKASKI
jgi:type I restriction enzyme R subunit